LTGKKNIRQHPFYKNGEISPYFSSANLDMLCGVACEVLLSCAARCANSPQQEFAK
jgi:hypothetical protein